MAYSGPIPIHPSPQNNPNAHYNRAFTHSPFDSPQSPPFYLDPRSPRTIFSVPAPNEIMNSHGGQRGHYNEALSEEYNLYQKILGEVLEDFAEGVDEDIWGFFTYLEYSRCLTRTYVTGKEFLVDYSANPITSTNLGLASLPSFEMQAKRVRQAVQKGIVLASDEYGNIYLTNESRVPVIVKDFNKPERFCTSEEVIHLNGIIKPGSNLIKVFDIEEFRSQIGLQIIKDYNDEEQLRYMSLLRLCFGEAQPGLNSPCWIVIANITALKMINNEEVRNDIQNNIARLNVSNKQEINKNLPSKKKKKSETSSEALRKTRIELRKQGEKIQDHMKYSWNDVYFKDDSSALNLETLKEEFEDPAVDYSDDDDDDESTPEEEQNLQVDLQRLKSIVRNKKSSSIKTSPRPVKHWAKLSYIVKQRSGSEAY